MNNVLKRGVAWIAATVVALTVGAFGAATTAHAEDPLAAAEVAITKDFLVPTNIDMIDETFNFSITLKTVNGVAADDTHDGGKLANQEIKYSKTTADGKLHHVKYVANLFPGANDSNYFKHAGEYVYLVEETPGGNTDVSYNTGSNAYFMHVFVKNNDDGTLSISSVGTWTAVVDAQTQEYKDGDKINGNIPTIDPTTGEVTNNNGQMIFSNTYPNQTQAFDIKKTVVGDYADKTKAFTFTGLTIQTPSITSTTKTTYVGIVYNADDTATTTKVTLSQDTTDKHKYTCPATGFTLTNGQYLNFTGDEKLPVGTTYTFQETGTTDFTPSGKVQTNGGTATSLTGTYDAGDSLPVTDTTAGNMNIIGMKAGNEVVVTNTYKTVTPTGILIDNLPWVLLVGGSIAGIVALVVTRRNKTIHVA